MSADTMSPEGGEGKPRRSISKKKRFEIFREAGFTCRYCGRSAPGVILEVEHVEPVSKGGGNSDDNLVCSCFDCNRSKGVTPVLITRSRRPFGLSAGIRLVDFEDKPSGQMSPFGAEIVGLYGHRLHDRALRISFAIAELGGSIEGTEQDILSGLFLEPGDEACTAIEEAIVAGVLGLTDHGDDYYELWTYHPGPKEFPVRWGAF